MMTVPSYVTSADLAEALGDAAAPDDTDVVQASLDANRHVIITLKPYTENSPVERGTDVYAEVQRLALLYSQYLYFTITFQHEHAKQFFNAYTSGMEALKLSLKAEPTSRHDPIAIDVTEIEFERKVPYSQIGFAGETENLY